MVALVALGGRAGVARAQPASDQAPPQVAADQAPAPTRATFISTSSRQWDVAIDGQPVCGTPCTYALFPLQFVTLRSQERRPVVLDVGRLPPGDLILSAQPLQHGMYAGGIVATTLGGMALAIGITFTAVGHARDSAGMTTAGLITGAAGVLSLGGGIYLMLNALPSVSVGQATPYTVGAAGRF
jgi:hypothetical protein